MAFMHAPDKTALPELPLSVFSVIRAIIEFSCGVEKQLMFSTRFRLLCSFLDCYSRVTMQVLRAADYDVRLCTTTDLTGISYV